MRVWVRIAGSSGALAVGALALQLAWLAHDRGNVSDASEILKEDLNYSKATLQRLYRQARDDVLDVLSDGTESCENWRKTPAQGCTDANECGKGWLFRRKQMLLVMPGLDEDGESSDDDDLAVGDANGEDGDVEKPPAGLTGAWRAGEARTVTVLGLEEGGKGKLANCEAKDLSILLRLQGPEALAQVAVPVEGRCAWTVEVKPLLAGVYTLDATLINWKGGLEPDRSKCNEVKGMYPEGSVKMIAVPATGGPFYGGFEACCTLCTRTEGCVAWSATNAPSVARVEGERCAMYSSVSGEPVDREELGGAVHSGTARGEEAMTAIGPFMSIGRSWCAQRSGSVLGSGKEFVVMAPLRQEEGSRVRDISGKMDTAPTVEVTQDELPLCRSNLLHEGRWVSMKEVECDLQPEMLGSDGWPKYDMDIFSVTEPEECFLRPNIARSSARETVFADGGYVWKPYDCRYDLMSTDSRQGCLRKNNITNFLDFGDSLITTSRMPRTALWLPHNPTIWSNGKGSPQIGERAALAGCVGGPIAYYAEGEEFEDTEGSGPGDGSGSGSTLTSRYCGSEAYWQLPPGQLRNLVNSFKPDVVLANWALLHRLWHHSVEEFRSYLKGLGRHLDAMAGQDGHKPRHMFWLSSPFLVSEREPHCVFERALRYNAALRDVLEPRGWIEVDLMSMTRKWGVDIVDGMHHGPPPTRMLAYMLMHHICHGSD